MQIQKRQPVEKPVVQELKKLGIELHGMIDTTRLQQLIAQQRSKKKKTPATREEELVSKIQEGFENLRFLETRNICSDQQIVERIQQMRTQIANCEEKLTKAERMIARIPDRERAEDFCERVDVLREALAEQKMELSRYERCAAVLERIEANRMAREVSPTAKKKSLKEWER